MFRVGQKVVCVDAVGAPLTEGDVYTVAHMGPLVLGHWRGRYYKARPVYLCEVEPNPGCDGFAPERFRPAVDRPTDISCFKVMLTPAKRELERVS